jgi:hypothetical protein
MRKPLDSTVQMVMDIYKKPVPLQSEIANPFSANKRQRKKKITVDSNHELPEDVQDWNTRNFVDFYAEQYFSFFKAIYKKTYASDCTVISEIFTFFEQNNQDKLQRTKEYIEWAFINNSYVTKTSGVFLLTSLRGFMNYFMQEKILNQRDVNRTINVYDDVHKLASQGKTKEVFAKFGIPIAATYFTNKKEINDKDMIAGIKLLIETLTQGDSEQKNMLIEIVNKSIDRSPYPESFKLINWREKFPVLAEQFNKESWWKDRDYSGKPNFDVERFL